jgi:hypothetical protein
MVGRVEVCGHTASRDVMRGITRWDPMGVVPSDILTVVKVVIRCGAYFWHVAGRDRMRAATCDFAGSQWIGSVLGSYKPFRVWLSGDINCRLGFPGGL